jgi:hypothetical protein
VKALNEALSFLLELAMLLALGYFGFHIGGPTWLKWLVGIGLPLAVAVFLGSMYGAACGSSVAMAGIACCRTYSIFGISSTVVCGWRENLGYSHGGRKRY